MKPSKHRLVRRLFALAIGAFLVAGWLGPVLVDRHGTSPQKAGYAEAGNRHIVHIDSSTMLFDRPLLIAERATISMAPPGNGRALSDEDIAAKLKDGSADLIIDDAKLLLDASGLDQARVATVPDAVSSILRSITDLSFASLAVNDAKVMHRASANGEGELVGHVTCQITKPSAGHIRAEGTLERAEFPCPSTSRSTPSQQNPRPRASRSA